MKVYKNDCTEIGLLMQKSKLRSPLKPCFTLPFILCEIWILVVSSMCWLVRVQVQGYYKKIYENHDHEKIEIQYAISCSKIGKLFKKLFIFYLP